MALEIRCEKCGKLLSVQPGSTVNCPQCGKKIKIPEALSSLPQPHVPANNLSVAPAEGHAEAPDAVMGMMAKVMPWVISVFLHMGLFLIMLFLVMIAGFKEPPEVYRAGSDQAAMDPTRMTRTTVNPTNKTQTSQDNARNVPVVDTGKTSNEPTLISTQSDAGSVMTSPASATTGKLNNTFFNNTDAGNSYHVVWVVDRSGSMRDTFNALRTEMAYSVGRLTPEQDFDVILFADGPPIEMANRRLVPANDANKLKAAEFLQEARAAGYTNPIPALQRAFEVLDRVTDRRGKLIYLLTDGDFPDNEAVVKFIKKANASQNVGISTFLYGNDVPSARKVLQQIAEENHGHFNYVPLDEE